MKHPLHKSSPLRYDEIGHRLKAYRLGAGLSPDEAAAQLGISRTALYRFERGELAKIETLERLADLLGVSVPTLLGVGIEYIPSAVSYFERVRQIEESSDHITALSGPISFRLSSDAFVDAMEPVLVESVTEDVADRKRAYADIPKVLEILQSRRKLYLERRPATINIISAKEIESFLQFGLVGRRGLQSDLVRKRRTLAHKEIEHLMGLIENPPIGVQIGLVRDTLPHVGFQLFRQPERKVLVSSPFRLGGEPNIRVGVAMITSAPDALSFHEAVINEMWGRALKGQAAIGLIATMLAANASRSKRTIAAKRSHL